MSKCTLLILIGAIAVASATPFRSFVNPYGDARMASRLEYDDQGGLMLYDIEIPQGRHSAITVIGWVRQNSLAMGLTTAAMWICEPIQRSNPDLCEGVFGWGEGGKNLTALGGSITIASFPWQAYTDAELVARWPKGVYTLAGVSSNAVTITLGGTDYVCGPGEWNQNAVPGPADSVVLSGSGWASVGISRTPGYQAFYEIDGVAAGLLFSEESTVTNELAMCVWRWRIEGGTNQVYKSNIGTLDSWQEASVIKNMSAPSSKGYDSRGIYRVGLGGLPSPTGKHDLEFFDFRVFDWWLSDEEIDRIHLNGVLEIQRRGIPRWK